MESRNDLFRAIPIFDSGLTDEEIRGFAVKHKEGQGLVNYLCGFAESDEENSIMRTYIVRDNYSNAFVGYFSLKAGMISTNEIKVGDKEYFDTIPGVELANFAINKTYVLNNPEMRGIGIVVFEEIIKPLIERVSEIIGVKYIYIFALPMVDLINRYGDYGFKRLNKKNEEEIHRRLKPIYDADCIFMFQEL